MSCWQRLPRVCRLGAAVVFCCSQVAPAGANESTLYGSAAERREAGRVHRPLPWLEVAMLLEIEQSHTHLRAWNGRRTTREVGPDSVLQLEWEAQLRPWAKLELGHELDLATGRKPLEELTLVLEGAGAELTLGKQYFPFGEFFSRFVTGPVLEFAETRDIGLMLTVEPAEDLEWSLFAFRGRAHDARHKRHSDWGSALIWRNGAVQAGVSYLSDLAEADAELLQDTGSRYRQRVAAVAAHAVLSSEESRLSVEYIGALAGFDELDRDRRRPRAWNLELAHNAFADWQVALRLEGSRHLEDEPARRWGLALSWQPWESVSLTVEYLHARYRRGLAEMPDGEELKRVREIGTRLSLSF